MKNRVKAFIAQHQLMQEGGRYLVALSGGADSVALLLVLKELGYNVEAVHCNFKLRGEEADRDETFVEKLCQETGTVLHKAHFDTRSFAQLHRLSIETAARQLRYAYFNQLITHIGYNGICVAHHADDNAETILMHMLRGAGLQGLTGMKPLNGNIIRPLLAIKKADLLAYLAEREQSFVTDSTNLETDARRNLLRIEVMPRLEEAYNGAIDNINRAAQHLADVQKIYDKAVDEALERLTDGNAISIDLLLKEPAPEALLYEWLSTKDFTPAQIRDIAIRLATATTGTTWTSPTHEAEVHDAQLIVSERHAPTPPLRIPEPGTYIDAKGKRWKIAITEGNEYSTDPNIATLDAAKVCFPLTIRQWQEGDRFTPLGMKGSKLVSDLLTDMKLPLSEKRRQMVVCQADNTIIWVVGRRPANQFRVDKDTEKILVINVLENS